MRGFRSFCAFVVGLGFGASLVWIAAPGKTRVQPEAEPVARTHVTKRLVDSKASDRAIEASEEQRLVACIAEIEKELRAANSRAMSPGPKGDEEPQRPLSYNEWFDLQREVNPVRYRQLTNGVVRSQQRMIRDYARRVDLLGTVDVSAFDPEDAAVHAAYIEALSRITELRREELARRCLDPDFKPVDSPQCQQQLQEAGRQVNELQARERFLLLGEAGRRYGLNDREAQELAETMHLIIETTSSSKRFLKHQRESLTSSAIRD